MFHYVVTTDKTDNSPPCPLLARVGGHTSLKKSPGRPQAPQRVESELDWQIL